MNLRSLKSALNFETLTLTLLCYVAILSNLSAQTPAIDSLRQLSESEPENIEVRVELLINLSAHLIYTNPDSALTLGKESLELAESTYDDLLQARATLTLGNGHYLLREYSKALPMYNEVVTTAKALDNPDLLKKVLISKGNMLGAMGQTEESLAAGLELYEVAKETRDTARLAYVMITLGGTYRVLRDIEKTRTYFNGAQELLSNLGEAYDKERVNLWLQLGDFYWDIEGNSVLASDWLLKALKLATDKELFNFRVSVLYNLGTLFNESGDSEKAIEYMTTLKDLLEETGGIGGFLPAAYNSLGNAYRNLGQYEKSIYFHRKTFNECVAIGAIPRAAMTSSVLALSYLQQDQEDSAAYFYQYTIDNSRSKDGLVGGVFVSYRLGQYSMLRDDHAQSLQLLTAAFEHASDDNQAQKSSIASNLASLYAKLGQYEKAYEFQKINKTLNDSLLNRDKIREMTRMESEYTFDSEKQKITAENEKNLLLRDQELQRQQLFIIIGIILVLALIAVGVLIARFRIRSKAQEADKLKEIGQFKEAMTGMIAHDLKNPLGVIMGTEAEKPSTRNMARQMLGLVNNMLDVQKFEKAEVKLNREAIHVQQLMTEAVEQVRLLLDEQNITIHYVLEGTTVVKADKEILMRVLINLLTNAIKYSPMNSEITLGAEMGDQQVVIHISDQGQGIAKDQIENIFGAYQQLDPRHSGLVGSTGLGLTFCKLALQAHDSTIEVDSEVGKGTRFSFALPQEVTTADSLETSQEKFWTLTEEERIAIIELLPELRNYRIHQAMQMETLLEPVRENSEATRQWVDSVLNAAYNGNEEHFRELVDGLALRQAQDDNPYFD